MFRSPDGNLSLTKILAVLGYLSFLTGSFAVLSICPDKFDYTAFAAFTGGGAAIIRGLDKYLNVKQAKK